MVARIRIRDGRGLRTADLHHVIPNSYELYVLL